MENTMDQLLIAERTQEELRPGVMIHRAVYRREDGSEFVVNAVTADADTAKVITGTAGGGYGLLDSVDYVPEQMRSAMEEGKTVVAGINAGYFRRKYHCMPYGLSVQKGVEIALPYSEPRVTLGHGTVLGVLWMGVTPEGELVFGDKDNYDDYRGKLSYGVSFPNYLIQEGECIIEPGKSDIHREPRSAFGVTQGGGYILLTIDGRQEGYSTGASNREVALVMLDFGVYTGVNLDGGGSTNLSVCGKDGEIRTINRPCENRKVFDTILLTLR